MIPEVAVEAAAIAGYEARTGLRWSSLDTDAREAEESAAQAALEAAAPHMVRAAYDLGLEHGANQPTNPYRSRS